MVFIIIFRLQSEKLYTIQGTSPEMLRKAPYDWILISCNFRNFSSSVTSL